MLFFSSGKQIWAGLCRKAAVIAEPETSKPDRKRRLTALNPNYRVLHVDPEYQVTVVGRQKRDFAWIMARDAVVPEPTYAALVDVLRTAGYPEDALADLRRVPHRQP